MAIVGVIMLFFTLVNMLSYKSVKPTHRKFIIKTYRVFPMALKLFVGFKQGVFRNVSRHRENVGLVQTTKRFQTTG